MADKITQEDLLIVLQQSAAPTIKLKMEILDSDRRITGILDCGLTDGSMSISGESDIRRTASLVVQPTLKEKIKLAENSPLWLNRDIRLSVGLYDAGNRQYKYYPLGSYVYTDISGVYDAAANSLTVNCSDFMKKLDGTRNGQLGALKIRYPAYEENEQTGEVIRYNILRDAVMETLRNLAGITDYRIDDMGEHRALPEYNKHWQQYRAENTTWNMIPFDQEFAAGCSVLSILTTFRDIYPNYEMFFDMDTNTFICQLKPMCYEDDLFLDNGFLQRVLISENTSVDISTVRNICEVWGKVIETDFYSENCSCSNNTYNVSIPGYEDGYHNGDVISLKMPAANQAGARIDVNGFGAICICNEADDEPVKANELKQNVVYAFKIRKTHINGQDLIKAYLLGQWQVHAVNVLTDGSKSNQFVTCPDGQVCELYSKEYFRNIYHCERIDLSVVEESPFTVEKLGEILDVKTGGEYENITSDSLAAEMAEWENWKNSRLTDQISITTALLPFLDVNKKVSYQRSDSDREDQYVISSVSHDFSGYTSTITMYRFYPLYQS